jgi:hypothetical protein
LLRPVTSLALDEKWKNERLSDDGKNRRVDGVLFYGQSNAGAGGHERPFLTDPVFPDRLLTFRTARQIYGTKLVDPISLDGIGAVHDDPKFPAYPATAMAYALAASESPRSGNRYFMHTVWYGGQPLTAFLRSTIPWTDLMTVARRARDVLEIRSMRAHIAALVLIQGESGPPGRKRYARLLTEFLDTALPNLEAQTGQNRSCLCIMLQTNASNSQSESAVGVPLAQWDVARARPEDTVLAGPMYQFPLGDAVHQSTDGRMMLGDLLALVYEIRIVRKQRFQPLHPVSVRRADDTVVISFKRPQDSCDLEWDESFVPPVPSYGFSIRSDSDTIAISGVKITGPSEVTIRLAPDGPTRNLVVSYAMDQPRVEGWAPGRGQLIAPTKRRSAFADLGRRTPATIAHYALRFELPVA